MKCPTCESELAMTSRQGIEIDYCPRCRGVWLDRGELDKILERSTGIDHPPRHHNGDDDDDRQPYRGNPRQYNADYQPYRKKKSFWSELFD